MFDHLPSSISNLCFLFNKSRLGLKNKTMSVRTFKKTPVEIPHTEIHLVIVFKSSWIPKESGTST